MPVKIKHIFTVLTLLVVSTVTRSQPIVQNNTVVTARNTYAIVIGIANYKYPEIPNLSFSGRDATVFANFLESAPGGSVPKENIRLLTDSTATIGEVDKALRWLVASCKEGDKVFFYFSGHGEMENVTMSKNGYLICYNTPPAAFVNMGLSIDYLNDVVNTISAQTKATAIVITDACHAGKMNENKFKGNFFVGEQLMLKKQNEIRMASCKAEELSNEKEDWGGGRGVFSYYLVNALQGGLADLNQDNIVSVGELKNYMEASMARDPVLKKDGDVQTPVISGNPDFELAPVIPTEAKKVKEQVKNDSLAMVMVMSSMPSPEEDDNTAPDEYFFSLLKSKNLEAVTDSLKLNEFSASEIPFIIIGQLLKEANTPKQNDKLTSLQNELKADAEKLNRFNLDIASALIDAGQNVIGSYLSGDEAELERRRYYNSNNKGYDVYTRMFSVAAKLSQSDRYYSTRAQVFFHYFSGLALRLKIPLMENQDSLIELALLHQRAALNLEEHAAYIYNELGVLLQYKKKFDEAAKYYDTASLLSPAWAIPKSNLCGLYTIKAQYSKALAYADSADALQKNLQSVSVNRGFINEKQRNFLFAEEDYHHAIDINSRHYVPFERLGFVNLNTANYALADSFFYEADLRKRGYHFKGNGWDNIQADVPVIPLSFSPCNVDTSILEQTDVFAFFTWGVQEYILKRYNNATRILRKVVAVEATNPLVYHYMGKAYYDQQKWEEASLMFRLAENNSKNPHDFNAYVDSVIRSKKYRYDHTCFENFFRNRYYGQVDDYFFSGTIHENWKHFEEAEKYFRLMTGINENKEGDDIKGKRQIEIQHYAKTAAHAKLWHLFERLGRYNETEDEIKNFGTVDSHAADQELNEFYRRMIDRFPENADWYYRLGTLLYKYAPLNNRVQYFDSIVRFPLLNKEMFIDFDLYPRLYMNDTLSIYDVTELGVPRRIYITEYQLHVDKRTFKIPGTGENVPGAGLIYMPRKDGITYLQKAAERISEKEALADIHFKTGNIYVWAGSKKMAYPYFEKSLSLIPDNANARLTLVDIYKALHKNRAAYDQLNYLCDSNQINLEKRILLARFNIYKGDFVKAGQLLQIAEAYAPYLIPEINNQRSLALMLAGKPKPAIEFYKKNIAEQETDNQFNFYSLARLYAKMNNQNEAWKYLQIAVDAGFNYSYVFQNDSYLDDLRKTGKWQSFISGISMKKYRHTAPKK